MEHRDDTVEREMLTIGRLGRTPCCNAQWCAYRGQLDEHGHILWECEQCGRKENEVEDA